MKLYSDTLTTRDLYAALPADVMIADLREMRRPRKRARGWEISLEGNGARHTRRRNSGYYGSTEVDVMGHFGYAATWDDHGVWMDALYAKDPDALIAWYTGRDHFYEATRNGREWGQRSRYRYMRDTHTAPWLPA